MYMCTSILEKTWHDDAWPSAIDAVLRALISVWHNAEPYDKRIKTGMGDEAKGLDYRRFVFFSPDIAVNNVGKAFVIEVQVLSFFIVLCGVNLLLSVTLDQHQWFYGRGTVR